MEKRGHHLKNLKIKIRTKGDEIENLRIENEVAKNEIIAVLKKDNKSQFTDKAEYFLELLLNTEQFIGVLRHDFNELILAMDKDDLERNFRRLLVRFLIIEKDILKTAKLLKDVNASLSAQNRDKGLN